MGESAAVAELETGWDFRPGTGSAQFPRTGWGHRGYEEQAVDDFVERVQGELAAAGEQIDDLRVEVDRLHRYIRRQWATAPATDHGQSMQSGQSRQSGQQAPGSAHGVARNSAGVPDDQRVGSPVAQARAVLGQAQEIAERRIAEATGRLAEAERSATALLVQTERLATDRLSEADRLVALRLREADTAAAQRLDQADSLADEVLAQARRAAVQKRARTQDDVRRLLELGRARYEEIVMQAHRRADEAAELALHDFEDAAYQSADSGRARAELDMKAAYLRTFATVSRAALHAALEVTGREFDRLLAPGAPRTQAARGADSAPDTQDDVFPGEVVRIGAQPTGEARVITMPGLEGAIDLARVSRSG